MANMIELPFYVKVFKVNKDSIIPFGMGDDYVLKKVFSLEEIANCSWAERNLGHSKEYFVFVGESNFFVLSENEIKHFNMVQQKAKEECQKLSELEEIIN